MNISEIQTLIILVGVIICYSTKIVPTAATALLGAFAMVACGIIDIDDAFTPFSGNVVLLQIGVMIMGYAFFEVGLAKDVGGFIYRKFGKKPAVFLGIIIFAVAIISAFISNTATVAMFLPIATAAAVSSDGTISKKDLFMPIGFASVLGGNLTIFGSTPQLAVQSILASSTESGVRELGLFELAVVGFPLLLLLIAFYITIGAKMQRRVFTYDDKNSTVETKQQANAKSPIYKKIIVICIYVMCIVVFIGGWISIGAASIIGALLCVITRCIKEKEAFKHIDWTTVIMLGGILSLSQGVVNSGIGKTVADAFFAYFGHNSSAPYFALTLIVLVCVLLTSVMSNTAVAAMFTPIGIAIAINTGVNPMTFVVAIIIASNISFCTPMATAPVTMTMSAGYKFGDYVKLGGLFTVIATIYTIAFVPIVFPFV